MLGASALAPRWEPSSGPRGAAPACLQLESGRRGRRARAAQPPRAGRARAGVGFFARPDYIAQHRGSPERICGGVFFAGALGWQQLGVQALGALAIIAFTGACRRAAYVVGSGSRVARQG